MSETVKPKKREDAKQETREALLQAGMRAFSEEGVDLPSLDAICARAGFTRGAFYVHFKDRDEFLDAIVDRVLMGFIDFVIAEPDEQGVVRTIDRFLLAAAQGTVPLSGGRHLFAQLLSRGLQRSKHMQGRYRGHMDAALGRLGESTAAGQGAGTVGTDIEPDMVALLLVAGALGLTQLMDVGLELDLTRVKKNLHDLLQIRSDSAQGRAHGDPK